MVDLETFLRYYQMLGIYILNEQQFATLIKAVWGVQLNVYRRDW